jgi:hypothetical protein
MKHIYTQLVSWAPLASQAQLTRFVAAHRTERAFFGNACTFFIAVPTAHGPPTGTTNLVHTAAVSGFGFQDNSGEEDLLAWLFLDPHSLTRPRFTRPDLLREFSPDAAEKFSSFCNSGSAVAACSSLRVLLDGLVEIGLSGTGNPYPSPREVADIPEIKACNFHLRIQTPSDIFTLEDKLVGRGTSSMHSISCKQRNISIGVCCVPGRKSVVHLCLKASLV